MSCYKLDSVIMLQIPQKILLSKRRALPQCEGQRGLHAAAAKIQLQNHVLLIASSTTAGT